MNVHDSEKMAGCLKKMGMAPTQNETEADLIILNTCSVREKAAEKVFTRLGMLKKLKSNRPVVLGLAGCVAQQEGEAVFARAPFVDFVLGTQSLVRLPDVLDRILRRDEKKVVEIGRHPENLDIPPEHIERVPGVKAFITIMEGCDNFCTFCIVPFTRGRERCRPINAIVDEAKELSRSGFKEIQLLGQNVNSYRDPESGRNFAKLLDAVHTIDGIDRIRFASPHPKDFDRGVLERYRDLPRLCPHMHLPAQSGSTSVLDRMRRGYTREAFLAIVDEARSLVPKIGISSDLIVGFPGETDAEFEDTMTLIQRVGFDSIFSFKYSPRPFTLAYRQLKDDVPDNIKGARLSRLQDAQKRIQNRQNMNLVGETVTVLVESMSKRDPGVLSGRTPQNRVVNFPGEPELMGETLQIRITKFGPNSLFGEALTG
jgi:tRNA-2-methylthio-N6-dimethylallyladenosine synthase